jgi:TP901 family phage tail tape measure protein
VAKIKGITVRIGADTTGLDAALKDVNKTSREISKELREVERLLKFNPHDTEVLAQKQKLLTDQVENTRAKLQQLRDVQDQVNEQFKKGEIGEEQYRAFQRELIKTESQLKSYEKQLRAVNLQNHEFNQKMQELGEKLQKAGERLTDVGKSLTTRVTAPLTALGGLATKTAIDFESAFAGVRKTVDATEEEFAALERGIRDMAKEIPAAATEIAGVAEAAGQLGIANDHILSFTRTMIDLGESTNMSAEEAATALARLANITQMPQTEFDKLGSTIVALGNNLATTEAEIVEMSLRLAGAGKQVGMTEAEILSLAGALSSVGIEAQAGGSAFSRVMVNMQLAVETGSEKLEQFAAVAGMSAEQFATTFQENAAQALIAFINGLQRTQEEGTSAIKVLDDIGITEVRMRDALLRAAGAGDLFAESIKLGTEAWEENVALTTEAEQRYKTTESQLTIMRNKLQEVAITFGEILLPPLLAVVEKIGDLADWLANLSPTTQRTIVVIGGLVTALGPALLLIGQMATGAGAVVQAFGKLSAFISKTLIPAITSISLPVVGVVAGIAGLAVIAYEVYRAWDEVKTALSATWEYMRASAERLALNMSLSFEKMKVTIIGVVDEILERLSILESLPFGIGDSFAGLREKVSGSVDASRQKIEELQAALDANATKMKDAAEDMKVSWGDVGAKVAEDIQLVINKITGQTEAMAAELDEQTEVVETGWTAQTDFILQELDTQLQAITDIEQEKTEVITEEASKQAEARAKFEADWNRKLFQLTADRLAQLEVEEAEALAHAEALEADKTAILEYYSIKRREIFDEEAKQQEAAEQRRLDVLAKFEEDWARKLFEATATELELLERAEEEAIARAEELGAETTAIVEYYALKRQEILDRQLKEDEERDRKRLQSVADFEEAWTRKLFEQSASRLEILARDRDEAIRRAEELGADVTAILEYYAEEEKRILAEIEAEREAVRERELKAEQDAQRERERLLRQWETRLFEQTASELELLEARMQAELQLAEEHGLDTLAILQYYENERQKILDRQRAAEEKAAEEAAKREAEALEAREQTRLEFEERWARKLFDLQADELERLEREKEEAIRQAEEIGADTTAILEYYAEKELEIRKRRAEEAQKIAEAEAEAERKRIEELEQARLEFEQSWEDRLFKLTASREELLLQEREQALARAAELGADVNKILEYYARRQAELAEEIADEQKSAWEKALDAVQSPMDRLVSAVTSAADSIMDIGKAIKSGNWRDVFLSLLMETEAFAKAMELIGKVLAPVVALFDAVLAPIINAILSLWNGIIDALSSISIFGWKPFEGLKDKKIGLVGEGGGGGDKEKGSGGRQVSEITGPTRDLLVDLLSPLANLGQIVAPIQDIRNILYERLPNFSSMDFVGVGVGAVGPTVIIENLNVTAPTTGVDDISRVTIDKIEKALAGRIAIGQRGRGGR